MSREERQGRGIRVLAVDDERSTLLLIQDNLQPLGYQVRCCGSGTEAVSRLAEEEFDVVLVDLRMPGMTGMEVLGRVREHDPSIEVIVLTAHAEVDTAIEAMKRGAYDYLTKPFRVREMEQVLRQAGEKRRLREENTRLREAVLLGQGPVTVIAKSRRMAEVLEAVREIAPRDSHVLILGESGTGKELVARLIHKESARARGPFLAINCGAIPDTLLESELFGHERGAFTGAVALKHGLFEVASDGTLFLDEVGEMSPAMQVRLLRVLDQGEMFRVGGNRPLRVGARIVAATNRELEREARAGRFREDLFYRLNVLTITLPPLRERAEDIPLLVQHFLRRFRDPQRNPLGVSEEAMALLRAHRWPGNIRELQNVVERLAILCRGDAVHPEDLSGSLRTRGASLSEESPPVSLDEVERRHIAVILTQARGNKTHAAKLLGISDKTLRNKIKEYGITV